MTRFFRGKSPEIHVGEANNAIQREAQSICALLESIRRMMERSRALLLTKPREKGLGVISMS